MKSFTTLFAASAFLAASAFGQEMSAYGGEGKTTTAVGITTGDGASASDSSSTSTSATTTATGGEATILPITTGTYAAGSTGGFTMTNPVEGGVPTLTPDEGLGEGEAGKETVIDGVTYIPKTLCTDAAEPSETDVSPIGGSHTGETNTLIKPTTATGVPTFTYGGGAGATTDIPGGSEGSPVGGTSTGGSTLIEPTTIASEGGATLPSAGGYGGATTDVLTNPIQTGVPTTTAGSGSNPTGSPSGGASGTCKVNLVRYNEKPRMFDVPNDDYVFPILRQGVRAAKMIVESCDGEMVCQAYKDKHGKQPIRTPVAVGGSIDVTKERDVSMGQESWVRSVKCSPAAGAGGPPVDSSATKTLITPTTTGTPSEVSPPSGYPTGTTTTMGEGATTGVSSSGASSATSTTVTGDAATATVGAPPAYTNPVESTNEATATLV